MELINEYLKRQREKRVKIHCVGDAMLDQYYEVSVHKISPECPMAIMKSPSDFSIDKPGGVANVAYQFQHLNVDQELFCFGNEKLQNTLQDISCHLINNDNLPIKKRFIDNGIQVKRWDVEKQNYGLPDNNSTIQLLELDTEADAVIFSDYAKGFFSPTFSPFWLKKYTNAISIVDPKSNPVTQWKGCTVFKPNANEAKDLSGYSHWKDQCSYFMNVLECQAVVITQGGQGVVGKQSNEFFEYHNSQIIYPRSVIGAGDCFVAFLAHAMALGFTPKQAAIIGYQAGAAYVKNVFNHPIVPAELSLTKIIEPEDIRDRNFKLVFVNGCFDIIHQGHIELLQFAKTKGDKVLVATNSDESIQRLKGQHRPIRPLLDRQKVLAALNCVDFVTTFTEDTPVNVMKKCCPDVLIKGYDHHLDGIGSDLVSEVYLAPEIPGVSTSLFLKKSLS